MKNVLFILTFFYVCQLFAQNTYLNQVLLLNEGYLDFYTDEIIEPVTVGIYSIADSEPVYTEIIEITDAKFSSDLIINEGYFYVAADNKVTVEPSDAVKSLPSTRRVPLRYTPISLILYPLFTVNKVCPAVAITLMFLVAILGVKFSGLPIAI